MTDDSSSARPGTSDATVEAIRSLSRRLGSCLTRRQWRVTTAESCTGGGIAAAITEIPGSSGWFEYGLVTYANSAKQALLAVPEEVLAQEGAVSEPVAEAMALGALKLSGADLAVAVSGIAGPEGGSADKPVGTVWFAWAYPGTGEPAVNAQCHQFTGDRRAVREQTVRLALEGLIALAEKPV